MSIFQEDGIRMINFHLPPPIIAAIKSEWQTYVKTIKTYPDNFKGRGIVMCAGGIKYFTCAWIALKALRKTGCYLPIEIWYRGNELNNNCITMLEQEGSIVCKNIEDYTTNNVVGVATKPFSILYSSFKEILFIDADNIALKNPEYLFENSEYKKTGALFWPDFWETAQSNPIWEITQTPFAHSKEQESGQILINKEKCWKCLNLCMYFNYKADVYYKLLFGDKDTFRFSWLALNQPFYMIEREPDTCGYIDSNGNFMGISMIQYDIVNEPLFIHRNLIKWDETEERKLVWKKIKTFKKNTLEKKYINGYSNIASHYYMDFQGEYKISEFEKIFGYIEKELLELLRHLRSTHIYSELLLTYYIKHGQKLNNFL
ncbi:MAG: hypothetical protein DI598_12205 [Pseudopedobacter saltans]|uniref:Alpha 1,2-mannosyltransferase n=1 Tax=Pseudopedobacter saltans TaxID=151895 RepID=A0A2W5GWI7_9SPHI|nr:MAG: hypothetical protein DI598_12205 [Pseudopedobacter saltans]